jgi:hypothetical protein
MTCSSVARGCALPGLTVSDKPHVGDVLDVLLVLAEGPNMLFADVRLVVARLLKAWQPEDMHVLGLKDNAVKEFIQ